VLVLTGVQLTNAGTYRVSVTNLYGGTTSGPVALNVIVPPTISVQPRSTNLLVGQSLYLDITADGASEYQWRKNGANIDGATNAWFTIPSVVIPDGGSYTVVVANDAGALISEIAEVIVLSEQPPQVADLFEQRVNLVIAPGPPVYASGYSTNATKEPGEPDHAGRFGGKSVWFKWTAPASGIATFNTYGSTFDTVLAVYTGTKVTNLVEVAANDDDDNNGLSPTNRFFASEVRFNATGGTEYAIAVDGFGGVGGHVVLLGQFESTTQLLPVITVQPQSHVERIGADVMFQVSATGANLKYQWYFNGFPLAGATGPELVRVAVGPVQVGTYSVRVSNSVSGRYADSRKAVLELSSDPAQLVLLQDKLDGLVRVGAQPAPAPHPRRQDAVLTQGDAGQFFYSVGAGTVGYHVGNNVPGRTDLKEPNLANIIGNASLWLYYTTTNAGVLTVDTAGSGVDTLFGVCRGDVSYRELKNHILGWATNAADAAVVNSVRVTNGVGGGKFLVLADAVKVTGVLKLNWAFGTWPTPAQNAPAATVFKLDVGANYVLRLSEASATNAAPAPLYGWYRDGTFLGWTMVPEYRVNGMGYGHSGLYSVVASNALGVSTYVLDRLLVKAPLAFTPGTWWYQNGQFHMQLRGTEGDAVQLERTGDLQRWDLLWDKALTSYETTVTDPDAGSVSNRYYRVRSRP
jgi:hypothetical protein